MNNVEIDIIRGDNRTFKFQRKTEQGTLISDLPNEMYITFKPNDVIQDYVIQKVYSKEEITFDNLTGFWSFELEPKDTTYTLTTTM